MVQQKDWFQFSVRPYKSHSSKWFRNIIFYSSLSFHKLVMFVNASNFTLMLPTNLILFLPQGRKDTLSYVCTTLQLSYWNLLDCTWMWRMNQDSECSCPHTIFPSGKSGKKTNNPTKTTTTNNNNNTTKRIPENSRKYMLFLSVYVFP